MLLVLLRTSIICENRVLGCLQRNSWMQGVLPHSPPPTRPLDLGEGSVGDKILEWAQVNMVRIVVNLGGPGLRGDLAKLSTTETETRTTNEDRKSLRGIKTTSFVGCVREYGSALIDTEGRFFAFRLINAISVC